MFFTLKYGTRPLPALIPALVIMIKIVFIWISLCLAMLTTLYIFIPVHLPSQAHLEPNEAYLNKGLNESF